ncbi:MAG: response regulator [Chitinispirillaceae bacterium]
MNKTILIVDDAKEIRQLVKATLEFEGCTVVEANNGAKAVKAAKEIKPDLIIMDMAMPGEINGIEATKAIKQFEGTSDCKIIMLTGSEGEHRKNALDAGASEFFRKPFSPLNLINKVDELLGKGS